ncbi:uncharacterized protein TNIN_181551 [Trichonephila inaurata madagascariensis]|uniref:Uncharacterized protein n=1 Tax=Trichonephila inaurata madagascariensis TaxID=2747483 RepID=A0A8X6WWD1_9ARAC|nr:uncharacterized protein TNIN_181551 [Trichonephila inaurata madagascariensis]
MEKHWFVVFILFGIRLALAQTDVTEENLASRITSEPDSTYKSTEQTTVDSTTSIKGEKTDENPPQPAVLFRAPSSIKTANFGQRVKQPETSSSYALPWSSEEVTPEKTTFPPVVTTQSTISVRQPQWQQILPQQQVPVQQPHYQNQPQQQVQQQHHYQNQPQQVQQQQQTPQQERVQQQQKEQVQKQQQERVHQHQQEQTHHHHYQHRQQPQPQQQLHSHYQHRPQQQQQQQPEQQQTQGFQEIENFPKGKQYKSSTIKTAPPAQQVQQQETVNEVDPKTKSPTPFNSQLSEEERLKKADQALEEFFGDVMQNLSVKMKTGMDEPLGEILDPVRLDDMQLQPLVAGEVFDVKMKQITVGGLSDYKITQLESQLNESRIKIGIHYPKLYANCLFRANGTLYEIFKVTGKGNATIIFNEVHARTVLYLTKDNGVLQVTSADQPYVDFSSAEILFLDEEAKEGAEPVKAESVATQLGPLYFWVLTANAVDKIDYPLALYFNQALKDFPLQNFLEGHIFRQRHLRIHVPHNPLPYAYVSSEFGEQIKASA